MERTLSSPPDLFDAESRALEAAREAQDLFTTAEPSCQRAFDELFSAYEKLLRETRRLVRRSDRAELEMTQLNFRLHELASQLEYRATHDPLTDVLNRGAVIDFVNNHLQTVDLSMIVLDIDHFKRINDSFGHPVGDKVILGVVACLKSMVPENARIGRVGGEEFTVIMPNHPGGASLQIAQSLRKSIEDYSFGLSDASTVTASFGVSWVQRGGNFDDAYGLADEALYAAKRGGRNRVALAPTQLYLQCK